MRTSSRRLAGGSSRASGHELYDDVPGDSGYDDEDRDLAERAAPIHQDFKAAT
jgi:hypothetical protein